MTPLFDDLQRWVAASGETVALLRRTEALLDQRTALLRSASGEFFDVARLAREFRDRVPEVDHEPAARSTSPRSR